MKSPKTSILALLASFLFTASTQANLIVDWEDDGGDLVITWNGFIDGWETANGISQFDANTKIIQTGNGMHALDGLVDLYWPNSGLGHNWYTGPSHYNGVLLGDSFGISGNGLWIYMPGNYAGQTISGSLTFASAGNLVSNFVAGSRDLGFGENDTVIFQAAAPSQPVPEPSTLAIFALGILGLASRKLKK
ncbi:PEP-CTERM sorting domain-containing protein [Thalassotalea sp. PLHSN55]|uniref:PEP-CTERM sorting domain-containing protein n=1 Tax=Thalassotalea sp. PLHSN55 TaxID=3435888 RepID=UPI003F8697C6